MERWKITIRILCLIQGLRAQNDPCNGGWYQKITDIRTIPITSPGYGPQQDGISQENGPKYPGNSNCVWDIEIPETLQMFVQFIDMDIEFTGAGNECSFDYIQFLGSGGWASAKYCGQDIIPQISIVGTKLKVVFTSDDNVEKRGFQIAVTTLKNKGDQVDCNFDYGFCNGWRSKVNDDPTIFSWELGIGPTKTDGTGPSFDHTTGIGSYAFIDSSGRVKDEMGVLLAPPITVEETDYCLEYYVHNFGDDIGRVAVIADFIDRKIEPNRRARPVDIYQGNTGDIWQQRTIDIAFDKFDLVVGEPMQLQFIGIVGDGVKSDSAIDDVRLHKSPCKDLCPKGQFSCNAPDGGCAVWTQNSAQNEVCNGVADCANKRDEMNCLQTNEQTTMPTLLDFTTPGSDFADWTTPDLDGVIFISTPESFRLPEMTTSDLSFGLGTTPNPFGNFDQFGATTEMLFPGFPNPTEPVFPELSFTTPTFEEYDYLDPMVTPDPFGFTTESTDLGMDLFPDLLTTPLLEFTTTVPTTVVTTRSTTTKTTTKKTTTITTTTFVTTSSTTIKTPTTNSTTTTSTTTISEEVIATTNSASSSSSSPTTTSVKTTPETEQQETEQQATTIKESTKAATSVATTTEEAVTETEVTDEPTESPETTLTQTTTTETTTTSSTTSTSEVNEADLDGTEDLIEGETTTTGTTTSFTTTSGSTTSVTTPTTTSATTKIELADNVPETGAKTGTVGENEPEVKPAEEASSTEETGLPTAVPFPSPSSPPEEEEEPVSTTTLPFPFVTTDEFDPEFGPGIFGTTPNPFFGFFGTTGFDMILEDVTTQVSIREPVTITPPKTFPWTTAEYVATDIIDVIEIERNETKTITFPRDENGDIKSLNQKVFLLQSLDIQYLLYVKFLKIHLDGPDDQVHGKCSESEYFVNLANGIVNQDSARYITDICRTDVLPGFFSDDIAMTLYHKDLSDRKFGFDFQVSSVPRSSLYSEDLASCDRLLTATAAPQKLASPRFPVAYDSNRECKYRIRTDFRNEDSVLYLDFQSFNLEPPPKGKCEDRVRIYSAGVTMEPGQLEHELCGLLSVQRFSFLSNIIIEFTSDDEESFTGFFAQVYTMNCAQKGLIRDECACQRTCDDINPICDQTKCQPLCVCPPERPILQNGKCTTQDQCARPFITVLQSLRESIKHTISHNEITINFEVVEGARGYNVKLYNSAGYSKTTFIEQPTSATRRPGIIFPELEPKTEYIAEIQIVYPDEPQPDPLIYPLTTLAEDVSLPVVTGNDFQVEKMSNAICLAFTSRHPKVDYYRITLREIISETERNPVILPLRHPASEPRVCFDKLKSAKSYEFGLSSISGSLQSSTYTLVIDTLKADTEWLKRWYNWRYHSFNTWIQTFDQYAQMARRKGFWRAEQSGQFNCPKMGSNIPCNSQIKVWRDLNDCPFNICDSPPQFDSIELEAEANEQRSYSADWAADFATYKAYLYPQWTALLSSYTAKFQEQLNLDRKSFNIPN